MTLGVRGRVMAIVALATIAPTLIVGALAVRRARRDVKQEVASGHLALVRALGAGLDDKLQSTRHALKLSAATWADDAAACREGTAPRCLADPELTRRLHRRVKRELPLVSRLAVFDVDAGFVDGDEVAINIERRSTYGSYITEARTQERGVVVVAQARARTGELYGYFVAVLDLAFVEEALAGARLGRGATLWVLDARGDPVASSQVRAEEAPTPAAVERALAAASEGILETEGVLAAYVHLASFQTTQGLSWAVVLEQPTAEAYALATATTRDTLGAGGVVLAVALLAAWLLARRFTRPLLRLAAHMDAFGTDAQPRAPNLPLDAPGEIGVLARRFEEMEERVAERERLQAALHRSAQLAQVGALAAGVAHEINNPLTTILGYANLLLEDKPDHHPDRETLQLVADEARRVQATVRMLLDHARAEAGSAPTDDLDLRPVLDRATRLVQPTLKKTSVALEVEVADDLPAVAGDPRRLEQVFVNLAQNAAHAMDGGGRLSVRAYRRDQTAVVEVSDTGPGIAREHLDRIFEPFFTTKGPGVGTGLGLAICHQIVLDHGGKIEVESDLGQGSTFRVILGPR